MATGRVPTTANSPLTTKGDLFGYSTAPARLAVGSDGETIVADSSTSTGLRWQGDYAAGKNKVINGTFDFWQRGTSFSVTAGVNSYAADRWRTEGFPATYAISRQSFSTTTPEVPDAGQYYLRFGITGAPSGGATQLTQRVEVGNVVSGQTYTVSFWVRAASGTISANAFEYGLITGSANAVSFNQSPALTTTWQRVSKTITLGSGYQSSDYAVTVVLANVGSGNTLSNVEFANVQLESGSVATGFTRAAGTIQGELAACQRYYQKSYNTTTAPAAATADGITAYFNATSVANNSPYASTTLRTTMRSTPTITCYSQNGTAAVASKISDGLDLASNTAVASQIGANAFLVRNQNASTFTTTQGATFQWVAEAEL